MSSGSARAKASPSGGPIPFRNRACWRRGSRLTAAVAPVRPAFSRKVYQAQFAEGLPIAEEATIAAILTALKLDAARRAA